METAPAVRSDREYMNAIELQISRDALSWMAQVIDALTKTGAIFGQLVLPPDEAQRKRQAMGANNG